MAVIVGVDGSSGAASSLRWARSLSTRREWPLRAVLAWGYLDQHHAGLPTFDPNYGDDDAAAALDAFVVEALGDDAAGVEKVAVCDLPARALLEQASDGDVLVVGARGLGGWKGLLLGSVSQHVLHHATVPVAVVREGESAERGHGRVVVGIDGSATSVGALEWAVAEAASRGAQLEVVHSWQMVIAGPSPYAVALDPQPFEDSARFILDDTIAKVDLGALASEPIRTVAAGSARSTLLDAAEQADLLVVGARGMGGFRGMLLGSVSHAVAQHAACPVVVTPAIS